MVLPGGVAHAANVNANGGNIHNMDGMTTTWGGWGAGATTDATYQGYLNNTRIKGGYFEQLTSYTNSDGPGGPYPGTYYRYSTTYTYTNRVDLSLQTNYTINLNAYGSVSGSSTLGYATTTGNTLNSNQNTATVHTGALLNMRAGTINLTAGTIEGTIRTDSILSNSINGGWNTWNINQGTAIGANSLTINGMLDATGNDTKNRFNIQNGTLGALGTIRGSAGTDASNEFNFLGNGVTGTGWVEGNGAAGNQVRFNLQGGNIKNITGTISHTGNSVGNDIVANVTGNHSGGRFVNNLLNIATVNIFGTGKLEVGQYAGSGSNTSAQISQVHAGTVNVASGGEFTIRRSSSSSNDHTINNLIISGTTHIDRTTVTSSGGVEVLNGGVLKGHSEGGAYNNVVGDLTLRAGSVIQPFEANAAGSSTGVVFKVSDHVTFDPDSTLRTRMFARDHQVLGQIDNKQMSASDALQANSAEWTGSGHSRAKYDPVFGNNYELSSKLEFELNKDYYFCVLQSDTVLDSVDIVYGTDAFDRLILKSDMIGDWDFILSDDKRSILLRYRLTALHPTQGGLAKGQEEPNAWHVAKALDQIRYPASAGPNYDGNIVSHYAGHDMSDFINLFLGIQDGVLDASAMNTALRQLHAEPYAAMAVVNHDIMYNFTNVRERNAISALYAVESNLKEQAEEQAEYNIASTGAFAMMTDIRDFQDTTKAHFVENPARMWAAGFGNHGVQEKIKYEYGYRSNVYGGAIGTIRELGDTYMGFTAGFAHADTKWLDLAARNNTEAYMGELLVGFKKELAFIEMFGGYGYFEHTMKRNVSIASNMPGRGIGSYGGNAVGDYHDKIYTFGMRFGYQWLLGDNWLVVPTAGIVNINSESSKMSETGSIGGLGLAFDRGGLKYETTRYPVMVRASRPMAIGSFVLSPEIRAGYTYIDGDRRTEVNVAFAGDPYNYQFPSVGVARSKWEAQLGATIELSRRGRMYIAANYDIMLREKSYNQNYSLQFGLNF